MKEKLQQLHNSWSLLLLLPLINYLNSHCEGLKKWLRNEYNFQRQAEAAEINNLYNKYYHLENILLAC